MLSALKRLRTDDRQGIGCDHCYQSGGYWEYSRGGYVSRDYCRNKDAPPEIDLSLYSEPCWEPCPKC